MRVTQSMSMPSSAVASARNAVNACLSENVVSVPAASALTEIRT